MLQKLFFCGMVMVCLIGYVNLSYAQSNTPVKIVTKGDVLVGETNRAVRTSNYVAPISKIDPITYSVNAVTFTISEVDTNARSVYDLQSNGVCRYIYQEPGNPLNLHACFMTAKDQGYTTRNSPAFYSVDGGATWTFLGDPNTARSGFPCVGATSTGRTVIMSHTTASVGTDVRAVIFIDIAPGVGSFQLLDPGLQAPTGADQPIWAYFTVSANDHIPFIAAKNAAETCYVNVCTNLTPPGTFNGYHAVNEASNAEEYNIASDGNKVGVVYITGTFSIHPEGSVYYMESNDNGLTYGTPQQVWLANYTSGDSVGALRDVDLVFLNGQPRVVFGLCKQTGAGSFFPGLPAKIMFWSPAVNGGVPVLIDSSGGLTGSNPINDVFISETRAVIGRSKDNNALYVAWNKARSDTSATGNNYFDVWYAYSSNGGANWQGKTQITNNPLPPPSVGLRDCRYPSISPTNNVVAPNHYTYLVFPSDSVPASSVNGADFSWSRMMFCKISNNDPIGVKNLGNEVPGSYSLQQNYPNPFNPATKIKFALPKNSFVSLKIYDISGREVAVLINQNLEAGNKEYEFSANNMASGVYFYTLKAGDFTDTKKMVLVK